eukprot:SAG11_NODE_13370_length_658_cov_0.872987_2_plen_50_part_01
MLAKTVQRTAVTRRKASRKALTRESIAYVSNMNAFVCCGIRGQGVSVSLG